MKIIIFNISLFVMVIANDRLTETPIPLGKSLKSANISPEIINELKDFENLIPTATIDEIIAEHYLLDGNFRTALKYLRSNEFTRLQRQLLTIPEVIQVLEYLHLTTINVTMHMGAAATLDNYNDNRIDKMTTNIATITKVATTSNPIIATRTEEAPNKKLYRRPQFPTEANNEHAEAFIEKQQPLVHIVLLENSKVKTKAYDIVAPISTQNEKHISPTSSPPSPHQHSLGTFTSFVEEVLTHLPKSAYQSMIRDKCNKSAKFAEFYNALRSPEFKPIVDEAMKTPNIMNVIKTLNSHDVDAKSLEPIAFEVISWGPKI